uniref:Glycosyltransferase n=1 Tax=viral metagenome TaxID=1070528 RepID=A0A6C0KYZ2_9ZZZZ|tara:strand:+ start:5906 stop:7192 length:1287 start_codon:yes stop_codon:yes gene_type:complete
MDELSHIKKLANQCKYYEDLYDILWKLNEDNDKKFSQNISIGLFNIACGGFGDIIVCKTFHDYLKEWYPRSKITICTTSPEKYSELGIRGKIVHLRSKTGKDEECVEYGQLKRIPKEKFDIMVVIPIINQSFQINQFKKMIPYANVFNTFTVSEYNGLFPPYTFPIGVGNGNMGILLNDFKLKQQTLMKKPYAVVYIQPSPEWGIHAKYCFQSYLEMIGKNYSKHKHFEIVIPNWILEEMDGNKAFYYTVKKILGKNYKNIDIIYPDKGVFHMMEDETNKTRIVLRGDILPQKRDIFISIMKDSVQDILVTGDQSFTDIISCCRGKRVWYQIAPWKKDFANNLFKHMPNKYFKSFKTSCGTLQSVDTNIDWKNFLKEYDFRIHGKKRFDSILKGREQMMKTPYLKELLNIIEHSRYLETALKKIKQLK